MDNLILEEINSIKKDFSSLETRVTNLEKKIESIQPDKKKISSSAGGWI